MKLLWAILLSFSFHLSFAETYYVKTGGGTGSGLNDANAWSFAKFRLSTLRPGDNVLFKRGDIFYGAFIFNRAILNSRHSFGAYGKGQNPVISGFTRLRSWISFARNIYYTTVDLPVVNMLTINGKVSRIGRYPNTGYLPYQSHSGDSMIHSHSALPFDPAGGEIVIRKARWILDRHTVISYDRGTIRYILDKDFGRSSYSPVDGNGFFIQNSVKTLDQNGEWCYDKAARRLYLYLDEGVPGDKVINVAAVSKIVSISSLSDLHFDHIDFTGGDYAFYLQGAANVTISSCNFDEQGITAFYAINSKNIVFSSGKITRSNNNGFWAEYNVDGVKLQHTIISGIGTIPGMGRNGDGNYIAVKVYGNNALIQDNKILNVGYNGIDFTGNNILIKNNLVDGFCMVKDDGAGIYTYNGSTPARNRVIRGNTVLNGVGAFKGAEANYWEPWGKSAGIYLDQGSSETKVDSNIVSHSPWGGIFLNCCDNNQVTRNLVNDCAQQMLIAYGAGAIPRNLTITDNRFIAKTSKQKGLYLRQDCADDPARIGTINHNAYFGPERNSLIVTVYHAYNSEGEMSFSLAAWQLKYRQDINSTYVLLR